MKYTLVFNPERQLEKGFEFSQNNESFNRKESESVFRRHFKNAIDYEKKFILKTKTSFLPRGTIRTFKYEDKIIEFITDEYEVRNEEIVLIHLQIDILKHSGHTLNNLLNYLVNNWKIHN